MKRIAMQRREFITLLGGAAAGSAASWPLAAHAQQAGNVRTVGFLGVTTPASQSQHLATFVQRLRELGWIEGRNLAIEIRWAEGRNERYAEIANEFVRLKVDVILTLGGAVTAAMRATSAIPIVFAIASDPVGNGFVASLARPGGNVTGLSQQTTDLVGKRVEMLREVAPGLRRLAILANVGYPGSELEMGEVQAAARTLGVEAVTLEIRRAEDIAPAFEGISGRADALYVCTEPLVSTNRIRINTLALAARLPTMYSQRDYVQTGGMISYGASYTQQYRRAAEFVDKILRGTKPADIPVEQPTKFELVVNLTTAKALGLKIPETFLVRADEVIE
jgi:putative tryptophan/tyrosine transport system substrate-binding protein